MRHCEECGSLGHDPQNGLVECSHCGGRGEVRETKNSFFGAFAQVKECSKCNGAGQIPKKPCNRCVGSGLKKGEKEVLLDIRPGVHDGQIIKIKGGGEDGSHSSESGDAYVRIAIKPHLVFRRHGDDLIIKKEVSVLDILLNKKIHLPTIEGEKINAEVPVEFNLKVFHIIR